MTGQSAWVKSSFSYANGDCVEVTAADGGVLVRDSKNPSRPALRFTRGEWEAFIAGVKNAEFDEVTG